MSVLDRASLEQSPLADLHAIASELSLDGYRRLRREALIDAILDRQGGGEDTSAETEADAEPPAGRRRRARRGGRSRGGTRTADDEAPPGGAEEAAEAVEPELEESEQAPAQTAESIVEGVVELLPNGSAFVRVDPPEPSDDDVYVSAAQVKRCELVSGDRVSGPRRAARRSERFASLVRIDTINGSPAAELAGGARFDELPAAFPSQRLRLESDDLTITAIDELAPIGRGSRVTIAGGPQSGKTETLRRLATALSGQEDLKLWLVLIGVRAEEVWDWRGGPVAPAAELSLAASADAQAQALEAVIDQARRLAVRGAHSVVLIDSLEALPVQVARHALAGARHLVDAGSLTVIATAPVPIGGETTVIGLDPALARAGQFPALDPGSSWTMRRELLAG